VTGGRIVIPQSLQTTRRWRLGLIELETPASELEMLQACAAGQREHPNGWNMSAMAVAVAASRDLELASKRITELEARIERLASGFADALEQIGDAELEAEPRLEVDLETLEHDYRQRIAQARALADGGLGWAAVAQRAGVELGDRDPTPEELRAIERWLDQNARARGPA
jgi:hypothetical protein